MKERRNQSGGSPSTSIIVSVLLQQIIIYVVGVYSHKITPRNETYYWGMGAGTLAGERRPGGELEAPASQNSLDSRPPGPLYEQEYVRAKKSTVLVFCVTPSAGDFFLLPFNPPGVCVNEDLLTQRDAARPKYYLGNTSNRLK